MIDCQVCYTTVEMKQKVKKILGPIIVLATLSGFGWYVYANPEVIDRLKATPPLTAVAIILLYACITLCLMGVLYGSLKLYSRQISTTENFYVTSYSSIINFFGPGQSGPAVRAAYLKLKHGVGIKQFMFGTLVYYGFYSLFSGIIIAIAIFPWWISGLLTATASILCILTLQMLRQRRSDLFKRVRSSSVGYFIIALAALLQVAVIAVIYYIELQTIGSSVSAQQALIYTGAANFALFVALTPGAIGFREAFIIFSQDLHHISNDSIVAANILDRTLYVLFLGLLFLAILAIRGRSFRSMKFAPSNK